MSDQQAPKPRRGLADFHTKKIANQGVRMYLLTPTGEETAEWLLVLGVDSDAGKKAELAMKRKGMEVAKIEDEEERRTAIVEGKERERVAMVLALVDGWSFDEPFSKAAAAELLDQAPQLVDAVEEFAGNRVVFFTAASASSTTSPDASSS